MDIGRLMLCLIVADAAQGKGLAGAVARDGEALNVTDAYGDPRFNRYYQLRRLMQCYLVTDDAVYSCSNICPKGRDQR